MDSEILCKINSWFSHMTTLDEGHTLKMQAKSLLPAAAAACLHAGFLLGLFSDPEEGGNMFLPKRWLTFNGLHGFITCKTQLFIF
jgi:hypothetical protein